MEETFDQKLVIIKNVKLKKKYLGEHKYFIVSTSSYFFLVSDDALHAMVVNT